MKTRLIFLAGIILLVFPSLVKGEDHPVRRSLPLKYGAREKQPMIATIWGDGCLYNAGCPVDTASHATCLHVPAGSGAVAMAQLMKYYRFPAHGYGEHGYQNPPYGIQYANFGNTNYLWDLMPDSLTAGNDVLANLIYQCGVAQDMAYSSLQSLSTPAAIDTALVKYFGYPKASGWKFKSDFPPSTWMAMMKTELDASHPLIFAASNSTGTRKLYCICDGYQGDSLFHFNFGQSGVNNGYYYLGTLTPGGENFSFNQMALFNLAPSPPVSGSLTMDFETVSDFSVTFGNWTVKDADQHDTYGITGYSFPHQTEPMAFLCFNPAGVTPSMAADQAIQPHGGLRFGACFSSNPPSNSDWFISPQVQLGVNGSFSFWVKSYNNVYGLDTYEVAVSVTDNSPASFTVISGTQPLETTTSWVKKTFNLTGYNNQKVYVAIHCVSNDHFLMMIDDLEVKPQASTTLSADFMADKTSIRIGETVNFTDQSAGAPSSWTWKFPGSMQGTSSLQNPETIKYTAAGTYAVSLKVSNGPLSDSITKTAFIKVSGYPVTVTQNFETLNDFSLSFTPWTTVDGKGGNTYGIQSVYFPNNYLPMAFIAFNPSKTTPAMTNMVAHSGERIGCSFSSIPPLNPNNKWLISPRVSLGLNPRIEFWVRTYNSQFGSEKYNVAVSITDQDPSSFIPVTALPESAPDDWGLKVYSLTDYANLDVYVGIQCVTNDGFIFMIDDIYITSSLGVEDVRSPGKFLVYPNPARDYLNIKCSGSESSMIKIEMISPLGEPVRTWLEVPANGNIRLDMQNVRQGVYLMRITDGKQQVTRKVSIIN
jgi:PKD repeat protein